jgi:hypothetical protein
MSQPWWKRQNEVAWCKARSGCGWSCRCYGSAASAVETWWTFPLNDWVPAPSAGGNDPKSWGAIPLEEKDGRGIAKPAFDPDQWLRDAQAQGGVHHIGEGTPLVRGCLLSAINGLRELRTDFARMDFLVTAKALKASAPLGDELHDPDYSITSSARCCRNKGTSSASALAVLRLINSSNLTGA